MATIKKYIKPCIAIVAIGKVNILSSSDTYNYTCSDCCKFWHSCQDRGKGKHCSDKEY